MLLASGADFAPEGGLERYLRLPYTRSPEDLTEAVARLAGGVAGRAAPPDDPGRRDPLVA